MQANNIIEAVQAVTKHWARQRKQEERTTNALLRRRQALTGAGKMPTKDAAYLVMEEAYLKASSNNTLPAHARQIMYAARRRILELTGKDHLKDTYFTQTLLPNYLKEYPEKTKGWDVAFDARGNLHEPHTGLVVPQGTLAVRRYLDNVADGARECEIQVNGGQFFPTVGPANRYQAILFIEKEGFFPLFQKVRLAERFDIAIMSTKGQSVTASRLLVDVLCGEYQIPLFVLHDFDKAGFSIFGTLGRDTRRYSFANKIEVIDLGLRLADIEEYNLQSENFEVGEATENLLANGATPEEVAFLLQNKRVELNAFTSGDLIQWIEAKLTRHGIAKVVPEDAILEQAFRLSLTRRLVEEEFPGVLRNAKATAEQTTLPSGLRERINSRLRANPEISWDEAVAAEVAALCKPYEGWRVTGDPDHACKF